MYRAKVLITFFITVSFISSCNNQPITNLVQLEKEILEVHNNSKKFHVEKLANEFINQLSGNHISVNRGKISFLDKTKKLEKVKAYFNNVEFEKWDDINPPIIRFSDDYSLAYTIVNKELQLTYKDEDGIHKREKTIFSWVAIYKKHNDKWKVDCVASTNLPSETENLE